MFPIQNDPNALNARIGLPGLRQTDNTTDRYNSSNNGNFRYQSLSSNSLSSSDTSINVDGLKTGTNYLEPGGGAKLVKSTSDQKLPDGFDRKNSFVYVNKNGQQIQAKVVQPQIQVADRKCDENRPKFKEILSSNFLVDMANAKHNYNILHNEFLSSNGQAVPDLPSRAASLNESNNSGLVQRENNGLTVINTSLTIQEPNVDMTRDHVKYINLFSMLCCWCFPLTGLISIMYARMTKKYFEKRDLIKAQRYLKRAEWMLIATFFFGFTLIAIGFAVLEHYLFKGGKSIRSPHFF